MTVLVTGVEAFRAACEQARSTGTRVGLVPTMGALHDGHMALVDCVRSAGADFVALSVFVNPLQFGPNEDYARYPRTLEADVQRCRESEVDVVFSPDLEAFLPRDMATFVEVEGLTSRLEGECRPGHFRGVTTIVARLLCVTGPCVVAFGRKDYQQWRVLERMVRDLGLPAHVVSHPIVREADGLALSSRNRYLTSGERACALSLVKALGCTQRLFAEGEQSKDRLEHAARAILERSVDGIDYVALVDSRTLEASPATVAPDALLAIAAHVGSTRLIDNAILGEVIP